MSDSKKINVLEEKVQMLADIKNEFENIWEPVSNYDEICDLKNSINKYKDMFAENEDKPVENLSLSPIRSSPTCESYEDKEIIVIKNINEEFDVTILEDSEEEQEQAPEYESEEQRFISLKEELENSGYIDTSMLVDLELSTESEKCESPTENPIYIELNEIAAGEPIIDDNFVDDYYMTGGLLDYFYKNKAYVTTIVGGAAVGGLLFGGVGIFFGAIPAVISGGTGTAVGGIVATKIK